jgi:sigma-B regulation protein RsbU (phosphoserine phosphatase)
VAELNQVLVENSPSNKFATLFYGELDPESNTFTYVNAGHNPALLVRAAGSAKGQAREILELTSTGPLVGLIPGASFSSATVILEAGDTLFLYTDGISEWTDAAGEELGTEGIADFLRREPIADSRRLILRLRQHLTEFGGGGDLDDDSTVVVVRSLEQ